ncbi:MAG: thioredoxin [Chloroflexota bacterium]
MAENVATVSDSNFKSDVLDSETPVLVDFWAEWCGPCRMISPVVEEMANEHKGQFKLVKMNVDENPNTPRQYGIMSIPTLILFKNGQDAERIIGFMPKEKLWKRLESHVS